MSARSPCSTLFPYTTLFRSALRAARGEPELRLSRSVLPSRLGPGPRPSRPDLRRPGRRGLLADPPGAAEAVADRKSTRLNSSHQIISYAVFCLKKKNTSRHM